MHDALFQVLYLGEDSAWSRISGSLNEAAHFHLRIHRTQSLNELFLVLAGGRWHAATIDIQAWKYQGLHYVDKIRSEYPAFPILALYPVTEGELAMKAKNSGASRCLAIEELSMDAIQLAVLSCLSEKKSQSHFGRVPVSQIGPAVTDPAAAAASSPKNDVISHALKNLLCVINANADVLAEHVGPSDAGVRSLAEIKKAARSAADLMQLLR
jgi:hypothetical protein